MTELTLDQEEKFAYIARMMMEWLEHNTHPHTSVYITSRHAELLEGQKSIVI